MGQGYRRRFGLYYVEFASGRRIAKRSAQFYRGVARSGELAAAGGSGTVRRHVSIPRGGRAAAAESPRSRKLLAAV